MKTCRQTLLWEKKNEHRSTGKSRSQKGAAGYPMAFADLGRHLLVRQKSPANPVEGEI